jgi:hypothetical protein
VRLCMWGSLAVLLEGRIVKVIATLAVTEDGSS